MPTYRVTDPQTGKTLRLTGDSPPTEQELTEIFSQYQQPQAVPVAPQQVSEPEQPRGKGFLQTMGEELIAPAKQLQKAQQETPAWKRLLGSLLGPAGIAITAPKGEKLKTAGAIAELGTYAIPGGAAVKGVSTAAKMIKAAKTGAVASGVYGAGSATRRGEGLAQTVQEAGVGAVTGAAANPILSGVARVVEKSALKKATKLYNSVLGITKGEAKETIKTGAKTVGQKVAERGGLPGLAKTRAGIQQVSKDAIEKLENRIEPLLKNINQKFGFDDVIAPLNEARAYKASIPGEESAVARLDKIANTAKNFFKGGTKSAAEINTLKRNLYREIGKAFEKPEAERAITAEAQSLLARGIKKSLENADQTGKLGKLNAEQGLHLSVQKKIVEAIAKGEVKNVQDAARLLGSWFSTGNVIRRGAEAGVGALVGGIPGAIALPAAEIISKATPVVTARAKHAATVASKKLPSKAVGFLRQLITKAVGENVRQK